LQSAGLGVSKPQRGKALHPNDILLEESAALVDAEVTVEREESEHSRPGMTGLEKSGG
jgi:hypothetical protein